MPSGHVFMATSLDGFVAREDFGLDWLMKQKTQGEDHGYEAFISGMDGLVMGSGSFRTAMTFAAWPYAKPVVVLSKTLTKGDIPPAIRHKVRVSNQTPQEVMRSLAALGWHSVYVDGGRVIHSFLRAGLIADMTITVVPILIGSGKRMFGDLPADIDLRLLGTRAHPSGLVTLTYAIL